MYLSHFYFIFSFFFCVSTVSCLADDKLLESLIAENNELRKKILSVEAKCELLFNKIQLLEEDSSKRERISKRLLATIPQHQEKPAFSATLSTHMTGLGKGQGIVFDHVLTNNGNMYSSYTGVFTSPNNGTYFFTATVMAFAGDYVETEIVVNGNELVLMYSYDKGAFEQGTNSMIIKLREGDRVWVRHRGTEGTQVFGYHWSTFSGFQVSE